MTTPPASATTPLGDLLRQIASRSASSDQTPLLHSGEITLPDAAPIQLSLDPELLVAWRALLGETGLSWQAEALSLARRGAGLALFAAPPLGPATLLLLVAEHIRAQAGGTVLLLAADEVMLNDLITTTQSVDALLGGGLPHLVIQEQTRPPRHPIPLMMLTFDMLHRRLLRSHDRAWANLWADLRAIMLPAFDDAPGAAAGHIRWLLRRIARLLPLARPLPVYASLRPVPDPATTLSILLDHPPPTVLVNTARLPLTWAIWRGAGQPIEAAIHLAGALRTAGIAAQLGSRHSLERAILARAGAERGVTVGLLASSITPALIIPGLLDGATLPALAAVGYQLVVMISDDSPAAVVVERQPALLTPSGPLAWPITANNAYVGSAHLRCAAEERPLQAAELDEWQARDLVERLETRHELARLPGSTLAWQPVAQTTRRDSYADLDPASAGGSTIAVFDETETLLARVDAISLERTLYPGAALQGVQVVSWSDDGSVTVRFGQSSRTAPERSTRVTIREQLAERSLDGGRADHPLRLGKVVVSEEITARRVLMSDRSVRRTPFDPPLRVQWSAPAVWIAAPPIAGDAGRTLAGILPLLVRCSADQLVPCVDQDTLYLVEAQPGGCGLVDHIYVQFEGMLHLATSAARALVNDPLWGAGARADLAWIAAVLMPLAEPLSAEPPSNISAAVQPAAERRTRASMVASAEEVAARRAEQRPAIKLPPVVVPPSPVVEQQPSPPPAPPLQAPLAPDPERIAGLPAQPMRLPAQTPLPQREPPAARPTVRAVPPAPPAEPDQPKNPRPARRRGSARTESRPARHGPVAPRPPAPAPPGQNPLRRPGKLAEPPARQQPDRSQPPAGRREPVGPPAQTPEPGSSPARREPPPLERPPFQPGPPARRPEITQPKPPNQPRDSQRPQQPGSPAGRDSQRQAAPPARQAPPPPGTAAPASRRDESAHREPPRRSDSPPPRGATPNPPGQRPANPARQSDLPRQVPREEPPPPKLETSSDPVALLAKARRLREQREAEVRREQAAQTPARPPVAHDAEPELVESRFAPDDRVFCVPYGEGVVRKSRVRDGREHLLVAFADLGELRVDPIVNAVRLIAPDEAEQAEEYS